MLLNVGRTRVRQLAALPSFPAPVERLMMGAVWRSADVERWATETGRVLNYDALYKLSAPDDDEGGTASRPGQ